MHCVVIHIDGQAHNYERLLSLAQQKDTNGAVLALANINHILTWVYAEPLTVEKEEEGREIAVTFGHNITLSKLVFITYHCSIKLCEKLGEVGLGEDNSAGTCIEDRVYITIIYKCALILHVSP